MGQAYRYGKNRFLYAYGSDKKAMRWLYHGIMEVNSRLPKRAKARYEMQLERGDLTEIPRVKVMTPNALLVGPNNWAGQGAHWAHAASTLPGFTGVNIQFAHDSHLQYSAAAKVKKDVVDRSILWSKRFDKWIEENITHVLVESGKPFLGNLYRGNLKGEVASLKQRGIDVAILWHGTDIRSPLIHMDRVPNSYFKHLSEAQRTAREQRVNQTKEAVEGLGLVEFVSTPGLLPYRPGAMWLPQLVDESLWVAPVPGDIASRTVPVVAHIPSHSFIKDTATINQVCENLEEEGIISYKQISGIAPADMPKEIGEAAIVIDQLGDPNYGSAAIEAMQLGKVVVGEVGEDVYKAVEMDTGLHLPVVHATRETLEQVIRDLASDPKRRREISLAGPKYISEVHSNERVASILSDQFLSGADHSDTRLRSN